MRIPLLLAAPPLRHVARSRLRAKRKMLVTFSFVASRGDRQLKTSSRDVRVGSHYLYIRYYLFIRYTLFCVQMLKFPLALLIFDYYLNVEY